MKHFNKSLLAAIVLELGLATVADAAQTPNFYECTGRNVNLSLIVGSEAEIGILPPQTSLNLQFGQKSYSFQKEAIVTESTLIGDLWEVVLEHIPDLYIKHASVVIPSVSLGQSSISFKSQLILTTVNTPFIPTPFEGVFNPSKYVDLTCTASLVYF